MKLITIGSDEKILDSSSRAHLRVREYAALSESYMVFVFTKTRSFSKIKNGNFSVIPVFGTNRLSQLIALFNTIRTSSIGRDNTVISSQDPFEIGLISYLLAKKYGFKLHLQVHTEFFSLFFRRESTRNLIQFILARILLPKAESIRVVSERIKEYLVKNLKIDEAKVMVAPIFVEMPSTLSDIKKDRNLIVALSRLEKVKNFSRLIRSFEILAKENLGLRLYIYGEGVERKSIEECISKSSYSDRIILKGPTNNPFVAMAEAHVFVLSSDYEGWGMTAVESIMSGTPVCMTPVGCAESFIKNGVNGFISKSFRVEDLAQALDRAMKSDFDQAELKESLKMLLSKDEYLRRLKDSWQKALV